MEKAEDLLEEAKRKEQQVKWRAEQLQQEERGYHRDPALAHYEATLEARRSRGRWD